MPLIPALERQKQVDLCESEASMVYRASSRTARAITHICIICLYKCASLACVGPVRRQAAHVSSRDLTQVVMFGGSILTW